MNKQLYSHPVDVSNLDQPQPVTSATPAAVNPMVHGLVNGTHQTVEAEQRGNFIVATRNRAHCIVRDPRTGVRRQEVRWHVVITLFGPAWTAEDLDHACRASHYLAREATELGAHMAAQFTLHSARRWSSLRLQPLRESDLARHMPPLSGGRL